MHRFKAWIKPLVSEYSPGDSEEEKNQHDISLSNSIKLKRAGLFYKLIKTYTAEAIVVHIWVKKLQLRKKKPLQITV